MRSLRNWLVAICIAAGFAVCTISAGAAERPAWLPVRPLALAATHGTALGSVPGRSMMTLYVRLEGQHDGELDAFASAIQTPGSAVYGRYLTPEQFGRYFGAQPAAYVGAIALLRARGFTIDWLPANRADIVVHAPASVVSAFFQTPIDYRYERGRTFFANRYDPVIPPELHAIAVSGLDDYVEHRPMLRRDPNVDVHGTFSWGPADVAAAYDLNRLYERGFDARGVTMANATCGAANPSDLEIFQRQFGLPAAQMLTTPIGGALSYSCGTYGNGESSLDSDWATAVARNVTFHQVVAHGPANHQFDLVYAYIVNNLSSVHVVTTSWGVCEQLMKGTPSLSIDEKLFAQAVTEGQWWFSASGDNGSDDCMSYSIKQVSVDFPGTSPYVISVGGTDVRGSRVHGAITGWVSETTWQYKNSDGASGGGKSVLYTKPTYQMALTPRDGVRDVPDVALISDNINDGLWAVQGGQLQAGWGGTSEAAPQWAGLLAIVEQRYHNRVIVDPHTRFYQLAATHFGKYFHDIVLGNNGVQDNYGTYPGYKAGPGFDLTTGLGSFIGAALVDAY
jgi:kumamolisin